MIFVSVLTDILLGLTLNHISGLTLPFSYDMLLTPIVLFWYIVSELGSILENAEKMGAPIPRSRCSFFLIKRANAHRLLNRWAFVRFMAFYTMYFIFLVRGFIAS